MARTRSADDRSDRPQRDRKRTREAKQQTLDRKRARAAKRAHVR